MELKELLFQKCKEAFDKCQGNDIETTSREFGEFCALFDLIEEAELENEYCIWKEEKNQNEKEVV